MHAYLFIVKQALVLSFFSRAAARIISFYDDSGQLMGTSTNCEGYILPAGEGIF